MTATAVLELNLIFAYVLQHNRTIEKKICVLCDAFWERLSISIAKILCAETKVIAVCNLKLMYLNERKMSHLVYPLHQGLFRGLSHLQDRPVFLNAEWESLK